MKVEGELIATVSGVTVERQPVNILLNNTYTNDQKIRHYSLTISMTLTEAEYYSLVRANIASRKATGVQ